MAMVTITDLQTFVAELLYPVWCANSSMEKSNFLSILHNGSFFRLQDCVLAAEVGSPRIIGFCALVGEEQDFAKGIGKIWGPAILLNAGDDRLDVARQLFEAVAEIARKRSLKVLEAFVDSGNTEAIDKYRKLGFARAGTFLTFGTNRIDTSRLKYRLFDDNITIRTFSGSREDEEAFAYVYNQCLAAQEVPPLNVQDVKRLENAPGFDKDFVILAFLNASPVGICNAVLEGDSVRIANVGVLEQFRKRRTGAIILNNMLRKLADILTQRGVTRVYGICDEQNSDSSRLMQRFGLKKESCTHRYTFAL